MDCEANTETHFGYNKKRQKKLWIDTDELV